MKLPRETWYINWAIKTKENTNTKFEIFKEQEQKG